MTVVGIFVTQEGRAVSINKSLNSQVHIFNYSLILNSVQNKHDLSLYQASDSFIFIYYKFRYEFVQK